LAELMHRSLLRFFQELQLQIDLIIYNSAITSCEKSLEAQWLLGGTQWQVELEGERCFTTWLVLLWLIE
jgi:hypothetical protein